jgi:DNA-binding transcriptional MerR regulator
MGWSTREIAGLAGVTIRAVRHYHEIGLLAEPVRRPNGYKQYGVDHLERILRIRRLTDLGMTLTQITGMGNRDEQPRATLIGLEAELSLTIRRLERSRVELRTALERPVPDETLIDLRPESVSPGDLTDRDRQFLAILNHLLSPEEWDVFLGRMRLMSGEPAIKDFGTLTDDADEPTRHHLTARLVRLHDELRRLHPHLGADPVPVRGAGAEVFDECLRVFCNEAQRDVAQRLWRLRRR